MWTSDLTRFKTTLKEPLHGELVCRQWERTGGSHGTIRNEAMLATKGRHLFGSHRGWAAGLVQRGLEDLLMAVCRLAKVREEFLGEGVIAVLGDPRCPQCPSGGKDPVVQQKDFEGRPSDPSVSQWLVDSQTIARVLKSSLVSVGLKGSGSVSEVSVAIVLHIMSHFY